MPIIKIKSVLRAILWSGLILLGILAGCGIVPMRMRNVYGSPIPPQPHDPTVELVDFSYTPQSPIHLGDTLTFTATLNHHASGCILKAYAREQGLTLAYLNDNGISPDTTANDGIYTGMFTWEQEMDTAADIPINFQLVWSDGAPGLDSNAAPLTVEE